MARDFVYNDIDKAAAEEYRRWNRAIAEEVFGESRAHRPVYLDLEPALLKRIAESAGWLQATDPSEALVQAVRRTLRQPANGQSIFEWHRTNDLVWYLSGQHVPPPVLALLAVFSLAAEQMQRSAGVASNNYYNRLTSLLGFNQTENKNVQSDYRKVARSFWESLNYWLRQHEGRFGLPTAQAFDNRVHVGLSLSQALVREQDRARLPEFFLQFGLQPGQNVSLADMQDLLDQWMSRSSFTPSLRKIWRTSAAREQIAEVARAELEGWDGQVPADVRDKLPKGGGLKLALELHGGPSKRVEFLLVTRDTALVGEGGLAPTTGGCSRSAKEHLASASAITLGRVSGSKWLTLEVIPPLPAEMVLAANVGLAREDPEAQLSRGAKRVVPLKYDALENLYVEVARVELLEHYAIVCHQKSKEAVESFLIEYARPGWDLLQPDQVGGLPAGWFLYERVQIDRTVHVDDADLASLCPIAGTQIVLDGGFQLPGRNIWHASRPPELCVVAQDVSQSIELNHVLLKGIPTDGSESPAERVLDRVSGGTVLDLSIDDEACTLGDHQIVAHEVRESGKKGRVLSTVTYRIRSADACRSATDPESATAVLLHISDTGRLPWPLCTTQERSEWSEFVFGAVVHVSETAHAEGEDRLQRVTEIPRVPGAKISAEESDRFDQHDTWSSAADSEQCLERGHHYWILDPVDPDPRRRSSQVYQVCRDCGLETWIPARRKRRKKKASAAVQALGDSVADSGRVRRLPPIRERQRPDMDLLLDAMSYASGGAWQSFRAIAGQVHTELWFPREAARSMSALGHLDVCYDPMSLSPMRWSVAPATLVVAENGRVFLAGQRTQKLVHCLAEHAAHQGGRLVTVAQPEGPSVVELQSLNQEAIQLIASQVSAEMGAPLAVSACPATQLAQRVPDIESVRTGLPKWQIDARPDCFLSLESGTWKACDRIEWPGAYRIAHRAGLYVVVPGDRDHDSTPMIADSRLSKYLASKDANRALIAYDSDAEQLITPFHAPLPELFERVAVLSSGYLPQGFDDETRRYQEVTPANARRLWEALSGV